MDHFLFNGSKLYSSRFLNRHELNRLLPIIDFSLWKRFKDWFKSLFGIKPKPKGFCVGAIRQLSMKRSCQHMTIAAPTGSGKTQKLIFTTVLNSNVSMVITDSKGEIYEHTSSFLQSQGYHIQVLDFRPDAKRSHSYNSIGSCKTLTQLKALLERLYDAANLNATGGSEASNFWKSSAINLLFVLAQILWTKPKKYRNLANLRHLLQRLSVSPKEIIQMALATQDSKLIQELEVILKSDQKIFKNSITVASTLLDLLSDDRVARLTSETTLKLDRLRYRKSVLYIITPQADTKYYAPITAMLYMDIFEMVQRPKNPEKDFYPILMLLDEAANTGVIQKGRFASLLATVRSNLCGVMLVLQSHSQLRNQVGVNEAEEILANTVSKVYLTGIDDPMAQALSKKMGTTTAQYTIVDDETLRESSRPLMTPEEIQTMPDDMGIFIHHNFRPALFKMQSAYQNRRLKKRMKFRCHVPLPRIPKTVSLLEIKRVPSQKNETSRVKEPQKISSAL